MLILLWKKTFSFRIKPHFPCKVTLGFLLVDLLNILDQLVEDSTEVLAKVRLRVTSMDIKKIKKSLMDYSNTKTKKLQERVIINYYTIIYKTIVGTTYVCFYNWSLEIFEM